ncbi:MAG: alpha/beta hydrolase [Chloroflexi bacterium]|nr:alpha/beta hydrolase [Chloroflexota bacterium]
MKGFLAFLIGVFAVIAGVGGKKIIERRTPDAPDSPANHGLPFERVRFYSRDDLLLQGWWIPARHTAKGTIIQCHGQNGSMDADVRQAGILHDAGFNVLMFNFRAHGESEGNFVTFGLREQYDLLGVLDYLAGAHGIEEVGVLGFSMGAGTAILTAARTKQIRTIVADGAIATLHQTLTGWLAEKNIQPIMASGLAWLCMLGGSIISLARFDRVNTLDWITGVRCPILFIHGAEDTLVSMPSIKAIAANAPSGSELWIVPGCRHRRAHVKYPDQYSQKVVEWFEKTL